MPESLPIHKEENCCEVKDSNGGRHLVILGGGSAAFSAALKAAELNAEATIINDGLPIGGTCVNVGCVPSKTLIRAAEAHWRSAHHNFRGIETNSRITDFKEIITQKRELVKELGKAKYLDILENNPSICSIHGRGKLLDRNTVLVNGQKIKGDSILIATGAAPAIPNFPGLEKVAYLTNESAFELEELPESLLVIGGRYIALECAQMFARLGSRVTVLQRSSRILPNEGSDLTEALTQYLVEEGIEIVTDVKILSVASAGTQVCLETHVNGVERTFRAAHILLAAGRSPNTGNLGLETVGIDTDGNGFIKVCETLETTTQRIYAAGDVIGERMFVYTAAYEGALVAENALNGSARQRDYTALPWVVFTDPQVAGVGLDEEQAKALNIQTDVSILPLSYVPRSLAARDTRGFIKLIRNRATNKLVGGRILAPEGSELLMEISLAIKFGITVDDLARSFHPYLTLGEGVKLAALAFDKDVSKLSCCAG